MSAPGRPKRESFERRREDSPVHRLAARLRALDLPVLPHLGVALVVLLVFALAPRGALPDVPSTAPFLPPGWVHPLGTDDLGRDLAAVCLQGARTSLLVGLGVTLLALTLGTAVGLVAGLGSTLLDEVLMRVADVVASLPALLIAVLVMALYGGSIAALVLVMGLTRWPLVARLVRLETASLRSRAFVVAARAIGASPARIALRHILPHASTAALASTGVLFGGALVSEAALAFIGLGDPAVTSLGQLAAGGFAFIQHAPWIWAAPVASIVLLAVLAAAVSDPANLNPA